MSYFFHLITLSHSLFRVANNDTERLFKEPPAILLRWTQRIRDFGQSGTISKSRIGVRYLRELSMRGNGVRRNVWQPVRRRHNRTAKSSLSSPVVAVNFRTSYGKTISRPEYSHGSPVHVRRVDFCCLFLSLFFMFLMSR